MTYILQKINKSVFRKPEELMENIAAVTAYLGRQNDDPRASMRLVPALDGSNYIVDAAGEYWRGYDFVRSTRYLQRPESAQDFYNVGLAFGHFQCQLSDFPVATLHESIPNFHNTRDRYRQFHEALEKDCIGRAAVCREEIEFVLAHEYECGEIVDRLASGEAVIHAGEGPAEKCGKKHCLELPMGNSRQYFFSAGQAMRRHWEMAVPVFPAMPSLAFSSRVIRAVRPGLERANRTEACTLGSMEPGANCPSAM